MSTLNPAARYPQPPRTWSRTWERVPPVLRMLTLNLLAWIAVCAVGTQGQWRLLPKWCIEYLPMMLLSAALGLALLRHPGLFERRRHVLAVFVAVVLLFQPLQWLYVAWVRGDGFGDGIAGVAAVLGRMRRYGWFMSAGTVAVMAAIGNWRQALAQRAAWEQARADNLDLRLALEHQRMQALRAQLEPHFMFNALSAISALVRSGDAALALTGINTLSDLLRHALAASVRDSVSLADELQFVRDYLALQRLRYGARLRVRIEGEDALPADAACPPLLLQPLIENALRHELDCHAGASDILLRCAFDGAVLLFEVSNPVSTGAAPNPGAGLGLANVRARLRMTDPQASLQAGVENGRFVARVRLPLGEAD